MIHMHVYQIGRREEGERGREGEGEEMGMGEEREGGKKTFRESHWRKKNNCRSIENK